MNKKIITIGKISLLSVSLVAGASLPSATKIQNYSTKSNEKSDFALLWNYRFNAKQLLSEVKPNYEELSKKATKNTDVKFWIFDIELQNKIGKTSFYKNIQKLSNLNVSLDLKKFMLLNYLEKLNFWGYKISTLHTNRNMLEDYYQKTESIHNYKNTGEYWLKSDGDNIVINSDRKLLINSKYDDYKIYDHWFADDETYINWSNEFIFKAKIMLAYDKYKDILTTLNSYKDNNDFNLYEQNQIEKLYRKGIKITKSINFFNNNGSKFAKFLRKSFPKVNSITQKFNKTIQSKMKIINLMSVGIALIDLIDSTNFNNDPHYVKSTHLKDIINVVDKSLSFIASVVVAGDPTQVARIVASAYLTVSGIVNWIINKVTLGNGYTIAQNFNDHGLNDWKFQMKYNAKTMVNIAYSWSNNLENGVEWKVTDGWFSFPELYIKSTLPGKGKESHEQFVHLSDGNSFNFGNKISMRFK